MSRTLPELKRVVARVQYLYARTTTRRRREEGGRSAQSEEMCGLGFCAALSSLTKSARDARGMQPPFRSLGTCGRTCSRQDTHDRGLLLPPLSENGCDTQQLETLEENRLRKQNNSELTDDHGPLPRSARRAL